MAIVMVPATTLVATATLVIIRMIVVSVILVVIIVVVVVIAVIIAAVMAAVIVAGVMAVIVGAIVGAATRKGGADGLERTAKRSRHEGCREQAGERGARKQEPTPRGVGVRIFHRHVILSWGAVRSMDDTMPRRH
jgi:hypothetical protein